MTNRISSYSEFWRFYVGEHRNKTNRNLHFLGTSLALLCLLFAVVGNYPWIGLLAVFGGYLPAWLGHFFWEKNRPATFHYPLWSLLADGQMYVFMWLGRMDREVARNSLVTGEEY